MKLAPILIVGLSLFLAACGSDIGGASKGDEYTASLKQADEARKAGDFDSAIPLYGRALQAKPDGVEASRISRSGCPTRPPPCSATCSRRRKATRRRAAVSPWP